MDWRVFGFGRVSRQWKSSTAVPAEVRLAVERWVRTVIRNGPPIGIEAGAERFFDRVPETTVFIVYTVAEYEEAVFILDIY
jgi:hypothetical protein